METCMEKTSYQEVIQRIDEHLKKSGRKYYSEFYIGTSDNAAEMLFNKHFVEREGGWWIYTTAASSADAYNVKKHYIDLGMRGFKELNPKTKNVMVYCYAVTPLTAEYYER